MVIFIKESTKDGMLKSAVVFMMMIMMMMIISIAVDSTEIKVTDRVLVDV